MIRRRIGPWLVQQVADAHRLPVPTARCIVLAVLESVQVDLRQGAEAFPRDTDMALVANALALRLEHAADRCRVGIKWRQKVSRSAAAGTT